MSEVGRIEMNSVRAYVLRFALELGHCSMQSACLKGARNGSRQFSLYHLVREREQALRESGANHVSRLFVYDEFQKSRLLDRRVTRRRSAQKLRHVGR